MHQNSTHKWITGQDIDQQVNEILCTFDFEKVHKVMKFLNWKWASSRTEDQIPSLGELVLKAQELIYSSLAEISTQSTEDYFVMTGGFKVTIIRCYDGYLIIELMFVLEDISNRE